MSDTPRMQQLRAMLQKEPNDPFLLYGIGMEHKKADEHAEAVAYFDRTLAADAGYSYAYFQKGQTYELMGDTESARRAYREGIDAAKRKGDAHAAGEIETALMMLEE